MEKNLFVTKSEKKNKNVDVIQDGAIFVNGENTVIDTHLNGSYLITFNGTSIINNISYTNVDNKILEYITARKYTDFLISKYIISNDSELSFDNINILNPFVQIKQTEIPVMLILIIFTFIYLIIMIIIKFRTFLFIYLFVYKSNQKAIFTILR